VTDSLPILPKPGPQTLSPRQVALREAAQGLEISFLSEMLKSARFGEQDNSFSGSSGEDQFASFQRDALARDMVRAGGIGLTEIILKSLMEKSNDA